MEERPTSESKNGWRFREVCGGLVAALLYLSCGGSNPTSPSGSVPVFIGLAGAPFSVDIEGRTITAEGAFQFNMAPGDHEISGTYSNGLMVITFASGGVAAGGVRSGSIVSLQGVQPDVENCSASWGDFIRRQESFKVRFTVTTDRYSACQ